MRSPEHGRSRGPGRPPTLTRLAIVEAAIATGFDRITVTEMAQHLGVQHSALYRYFATRDDLVLAAADHVFRTAPWPTAGPDWRAHLDDMAMTAWRLYAGHPGLAESLATLPALPTAVTTVVNRTAVVLLDLGFTAVDAVTVIDVVMELALSTFMTGRRVEVDVPPSHRPEAGAGLVDARLVPMVGQVLSEPPEAWYRRKIALVLDGTAARLAASRA